MKSVLIVEDDRALGSGIALALKDEATEIYSVMSIEDAEKKLNSCRFDLVILDINLPDGSGLDLMKKIKKQFAVPVILLTAKDMETDIVTGLEMGADDYITKPFSLAILRARVKTQLRRSDTAAAVVFEIDDFVFDFGAMHFSQKGRPFELSKTEQKLLRILVENRGNTIPRGILLDKIWTDAAEYVDENALSVTVKRLRNKLEKDPSKPHYIKTVYSIGYVWQTE
ncbi:MAG: response regulator transcription factor [Bacillota bacterium]|jgi:DNA-binding response OmpR family regulator